MTARNSRAVMIKAIRSLPWILVAATTIAATGPVHSADRIRIATEGAYAPWNATGSGGELIGFEVDLARDLCRRMAADCEIIAMDWAGLIPSLRAGRIDAIMAAMSITDERLRVIDFAGPYATEPSAFHVRAGDTLARHSAEARLDLSLPDSAEPLAALAGALKGRTIAVQPGTIQERFAEQYLPVSARRAYDTLDAAAMDLAAGRVDAIFGSLSAVHAAAKAHPGSVPFGPLVSGGIMGHGVGIGVRHNSELKDRFSRAIKESTHDGNLKLLSMRWFGDDISAPE